jgi:hypothetical protein
MLEESFQKDEEAHLLKSGVGEKEYSEPSEKGDGHEKGG